MKLSKFQYARLHGDPRKHGWVQIGLMVLSIGLSLLAGRMLRKKQSPLDDVPTTLATRGSFMNWFIGVRKVGPVFAWAGLREVRKEKVDGGKGGPSQTTDVNYEAGIHYLGVGPLYCLHQILQNGCVIFQGPITRDSHPHGTVVDLGAEGSFSIYWGDLNQPVNTFLGAQIGVNSRWPNAAYIQWNKKRLGGATTWPLLDYVVERRPGGAAATLLPGTSGWASGSFTDGATTGPTISAVNASPNANIGYVEVEGDYLTSFKPKGEVVIAGLPTGNGTYPVFRSEVVVLPVGPPYANGYQPSRPFTRVYMVGGTAALSFGVGTMTARVNDGDRGANIAHVIAEMLFAPFPQGLQLDPNGREPWDIDSLIALGVEADANKWRASVLGSEGETAEAILGNMLQDHGTMLPLDTNSGALKFQRVRFPTGTLRNLGADIYSGNLPEIEVNHAEAPVDRLIFSFTDAANNYAEMTIAVDEDGQASRDNYSRARKVGIFSTVRFNTAAQLTELRAAEEVPQGAEMTFDASREARTMIPGEAFGANGFDELFRATGVAINPLNERVVLKAVPDSYGARKSDFITNPGADPGTPRAPEVDAAAIHTEIPEQLLGGFPATQAVGIAHIRAHNQISFASIHLSADGLSYVLKATDTQVQTGGTLIDALAADTLSFVASGPTYSELGPDNGTLTQDLSADLPNYGSGRQICLIVSSAGEEICFLQKAALVSAGVRRLEGLARGRYDTRALAHPAGAQVFIFDSGAFTALQDSLLVPGANLFSKVQPGSSVGQVLISSVPAYSGPLAGKGQVPIRPDYVFVKAPHETVPAYTTGQDVTVGWALSSGSVSTGAGAQNAGTAIASPAIPGTVFVELLTTSDVTVGSKTVAATTTSVTWTNAELIAALGSEVSHNYRVTHIANGLSSTVSPSLTVTKL